MDCLQQFRSLCLDCCYFFVECSSQMQSFKNVIFDARKTSISFYHFLYETIFYLNASRMVRVFWYCNLDKQINVSLVINGLAHKTS